MSLFQKPLNEQNTIKNRVLSLRLKTSLNLDDFAYLGEMKAMMLDYLQSSFATHRKRRKYF